ncbi:MAG: hypothetical protein RR279_00475 [Alistipes sp.]
MPFIPEILRHRSISIIGLEKNTGKTECLNYILRQLPVLGGRTIAITSIGIDGETKDVLSGRAKPAVHVRAGMIFATSEKYLPAHGVVAELLDVSDEGSALGRMVTARALTDGAVLLSGPLSTAALGRWISGIDRFGVDLVLVDGALSRMSSASPVVTDAMILSTGAACSTNVDILIRRTAFVVEKIRLPEAEPQLIAQLTPLDEGVWAVDAQGEIYDMQVSSTLLAADAWTVPKGCKMFYVTGALTDGFVERLSVDKKIHKPVIIVRDFTKICMSQAAWMNFKVAGGRLLVLKSSRLIAVCVNPVAPNGIVLDSDQLCEKLSAALSLPVYDIVKNADAV